MKKEFFITSDQIKTRVEKLAEEIARDLNNDLVVIGLLTGSFIFLSDLIRSFHVSGISSIVDFMDVSSYGNRTETSGSVKVVSDVKVNLKGRQVLLVDDIVDTGYTLSYIKDYLINKEPSAIKTCVLLNKPSRRRVRVDIDYVGFTVPDIFVVGYGLDFDGRHRELPYITSIEP